MKIIAFIIQFVKILLRLDNNINPIMDTRSEQFLKTVHKDLGILARKAYQSLKDTKSPVSFKIDWGLRSAEEQNKLYMLKKSFADGYKKISKHQVGKAIDVIAIYDGKKTFDIGFYYYIARTFEMIAHDAEIAIKWGGWFKKSNGDRFIDGMHFELS